MSGPYNHQQVVAQPGGHYGGPPAGHFGGQPAGHFGGQVPGGVMPQPPLGYNPHGQNLRRSHSTSSSSSSAYGPVAAHAYHQHSGAGAGAGAWYGSSGGSYGSVGSHQRRPGRYQRQVVRLPDAPQAPARQIRYRLPTPEPDTLERVYIQRQAGEVIEEITEVPTTPPPRLQERTVIEPSGPPQVVRKVVRVPPRARDYGVHQHYSGGYGGYQPYAGIPYSNGYAGSGYGYASANYQPDYSYGSYAQSAVAPYTGIPGANCFYV